MRALRAFLSLGVLLGPVIAGAQTSRTENPHGAIREACATCHRSNSWKVVRVGPEFVHAERSFPLEGAHVRVACMTCHKTLDFRQTPATCASCHSDVHKGELGTDCARCHTTRSFVDRAAMQRAHSLTRFPLRGAHATAQCEACHLTTSSGQTQFVGRSTQCVSCHLADFRKATSPKHEGVAAFTNDCASCHSISSWAGAKFDHSKTRFVLTGRHVGQTCAACHGDRVFLGTSQECASCHRKDYDGTTTPKHAAAGFATTCADCHNTATFKGAQFDHDKTPFPLTGDHRTATCTSCHADNVFRGRPMDCASCHQKNFQATTRPPHAASGFATTCEGCHRSTTTWLGAPFDHSTTRFPLTNGHAAATCADCHADGVYRGKPLACASCHQGDAARSTNPHHAQAGFSTTCESCHNTTTFNGAKYDHNLTSFPLKGAHVGQTCLACHADQVYKGRSVACVSCHQANYNGTTNPNHRTNGFPTTCESCHNSVEWRGAFDHSKTRFPLSGGHQAAVCADCHSDGVYKGRSLVCASCHQKDFDATTAPRHAAAGFPSTCETCHTNVQWKGAIFDHNSKTAFPLTGGHLSASCADCHASGVYKGTPTLCASCHQADFNATTNPHHAPAGFSLLCSSCHSTAPGWKSAPYDHSKTNFPLTGAHLAQTCLDCHSDKVYKGKPTTCVSCHQTDYNNTTNPKHSTIGFSTDCTACHGTTQWKGAVFDHSQTAFPLTGGHLSASCTDCHASGLYKGTPTACASCHQTDFNSSTNPHHVQAGFTTLCSSCHTTTPAWKPASWDHTRNTAWPLTGAHMAQTCLACHADKVYKGKPSTCVSCHLTDYNNTTSPKHSTAGYSTDCTTCHTTTQWKGANFDHSKTAFPLTGGHLSASCIDCHANGVYKGTPTACASCHQTDFNGSTNPHHVQAGFTALCSSCHTTNPGWKPASWDHNKQTSFALTGAHVGQTCLACHSDKVYNGKSILCISCHQADWNAATKPPHASSGFPTTCETCHTTIQWLGATFDHSKTAFPLTGGHLAATCTDCHANGVYKGTPTACASCHQTDFNNSTNPHHVQAGFTGLCTSCHTTNPGWKPASWDHNKQTAFALTGSHVGQTCLACHSDKVYKGKSMLCISCHQADWNATTKPPHASAGFPTTCETCHTTIQWLGATFDHSKTAFPLTGGHLAAVCTDCHINGVYKGTPTACASCHQTDFNTSTNPHHVQAGFTTLCVSCHTTNPGWKPTSWDHNKQTAFALTGAHLSQTCLNCHSDKVYKGKSMLCISCHQADWNAATKPPHAASGFPTTCETCHTTIQWLGATFDHSKTAFPLTGGHLAATCTDCHANGVYKGTPTACVACHQTDFNNSTNPHHAPAAFSTLCTSCHTTNPGWKPTSWSHATNTAWPLTGAHLAQTCLACHSDKVYKGKSNVCVSCHLADYNGATNPNHKSAGFPTDCAACHTTTMWQGATFDHDNQYFPIYSGKHKGRWNTCADCHVNSSNYAVFECILCHEHSNKSKVDNDHKGKSGYVYKSTACYACHPTGRSD